MPRKPKKRKPRGGTFAHRFNDAWTSTGWPLTGLADELLRAHPELQYRGISNVQLARYLDGELEPSLDVVCALADALGRSRCWMATGEGLPDPDGLTDHVRPLWRIDGPIADEASPRTPAERREARDSFEEGFKGFKKDWDRLSTPVQMLFGNLLARRMARARARNEAWRQPFWRGQQAAEMGSDVIALARRHAQREGIPRRESLKSPAYTDLLVRLIGNQLKKYRPTED